jgi:DNA-dependent RNA polymerase auxiliary subunit epsilon
MSNLTTDTTDLNINTNEYIAFDAISLREFIRTRLTESGLFTDQYLEGSNLTAITNIIAYSFHTLMFYLNKTSSESMFSEAQIYENINRIVKLVNYSPVGSQTSTLTFECSANSTLSIGAYTIPRYTFLRVNNGSYNFNKDITFTKSISGEQSLDSVGAQTLLYQGKWTEYPLYTAAGVNNETVFVAPGSGILIDHFNIDVYVRNINTNKWEQWERTDSLYLESSTSKKYEVRYNESRNYEIKFGDDINGKRLNLGDIVAVYYIQSQGTEGQIGAEELATLPAVIFSTAQFNQIKADVFSVDLLYIDDTNINTLSFNNKNPSTVYTGAENVESIRKNAPGAFRSQFRLITNVDFENFVKTSFSNIIQDVKVYNNNDYVNNHLRYLYDIGLTVPNQDSRVLYNQIAFSTSCNFNNVYVYALPRSTPTGKINYLTPSQKSLILSSANSKKPLTAEVIVTDPVFKTVTVAYKATGDNELNTAIEQSRLIVKLNRNAKVSTQTVQNKVKTIFETFFDATKLSLGYTVNLVELTALIKDIPGVKSIFTQRLDTGDIVEGISLLVWNPSYPQNDNEIVTKNYTLQNFQAIYFYDIDTLVSRIIIDYDVSEDTSVINL